MSAAQPLGHVLESQSSTLPRCSCSLRSPVDENRCSRTNNEGKTWPTVWENAPRTRVKRLRPTFSPSASNRRSAIGSRFIIRRNSPGDSRAAFPANKLFQIFKPHRKKSDSLGKCDTSRSTRIFIPPSGETVVTYQLKHLTAQQRRAPSVSEEPRGDGC